MLLCIGHAFKWECTVVRLRPRPHFQTKTEPFCSVFKKNCDHTYRFRPSTLQRRIRLKTRTRRMRISIYRPGKLAPFSILCCWLLLWLRASKDWKSFRSREKPHGTVCPPFWILTVEWAGARSCLFRWRHRFQIVSFSPSTLENSVFKKHRFQIAPLWRAFWNDSVFGDRFWRCSVDDSRIRSKTAPFSFENGLVWTWPNLAYGGWARSTIGSQHFGVLTKRCDNSHFLRS